ncbi:MAG: cbb3-type cytochrome c oxidase subunit 3 [Bacteroidetes bacterium]|nr:cbb3-type cytochrome c oxidase subunit 3 [Bacteroidota bacterium]
MKFINYLEKVSGIDVFGLSSLLIFFLFFTAVLIWVLRSKKSDFQKASEIPLN